MSLDLAQSAASCDAVVIGGGLAGLVSAIMLADAGLSVTLCERSAQLGGRAATLERQGYLLNLGPHALYTRGRGAAILNGLGIALAGRDVLPGGLALKRGALERLPTGAMSLATTRLFRPKSKLAALLLLASLGSLAPAPIAHLSLREWLDRAVPDPDVQEYMLALVRLSTYANEPEHISAGAAVAQLQLAIRGRARYLDGGWQSLVDALEARARQAGVVIRRGSSVAALELVSGGLRLVTSDRQAISASAAVLAVAPHQAIRLAGKWAEGGWAKRLGGLRGARMACLDLGLVRLPSSGATFVLGLDRPVYASLHSKWARLAPEGAHLMQLGRYLSHDEQADPEALLAELEAVMDLAQPGWRAHVVERRFLPQLTACHALPRPAPGGVGQCVEALVPGTTSVYLAGDWVGDDGMLSDSAISSAAYAARAIAAGLKPADGAQVR